MSDDLSLNEELDVQNELEAFSEDDFEEVSSEEVDRIVASLEELMETVESENISSYLEEALNNIYYLFYEDEEIEDEELEADAA